MFIKNDATEGRDLASNSGRDVGLSIMSCTFSKIAPAKTEPRNLFTI